jgi:hypothetical protein
VACSGVVIHQDFYFAGDDIKTTPPPGLLSFHFACYGAGTAPGRLCTRLSGGQSPLHRAFVAKLPHPGHPKEVLLL